jgi:hypothetical protein
MSGNRGDLSECLRCARPFSRGLLRLTAACTYASPVEYEFRAEFVGAEGLVAPLTNTRLRHESLHQVQCLPLLMWY